MGNLTGRDARGQRTELIGQHDLGERVETDGHMCPAEHRQGRICDVCLVAGPQPGVISTDRLARWQSEAWQ